MGGWEGSNGFSKRVIKYNVMSQHWSQMPDLQMARRDHGCSLFGETLAHIHRGTKTELYIVIAGGTNGAGT